MQWQGSIEPRRRAASSMLSQRTASATLDPRCSSAISVPVVRTGGRLGSAALPLGVTVRGAREHSSGAPPPSRCSTRCEPAAVSSLPHCPLSRQSEAPVSTPRVPSRRAGARPGANRVTVNSAGKARAQCEESEGAGRGSLRHRLAWPTAQRTTSPPRGRSRSHAFAPEGRANHRTSLGQVAP